MPGWVGRPRAAPAHLVLDHESFSLYESHRGQFFTDAAPDHGLAQATRLMSGWGVKFFDYDNDGNVDLLLCNGHPDLMVEQRLQNVGYRERLLLFQNTGKGWKNLSAQSGPIFSRALAGRGMAVGDFDNDGSLDVLIAQNDDAPVLLRNHAGKQNHWLGLKLVGRKENSDAIGAKVTYQAGD